MQTSIDARLILIIAASLSASGCAMRWHKLEEPAARTELPSPIRVTTTSGKHIVMYKPSITDDKIVGLSQEPYDSVTPRKLSVRLSAVAQVEYGEPSPGERISKISGRVIGGAVLATLAALLILVVAWGDTE